MVTRTSLRCGLIDIDFVHLPVGLARVDEPKFRAMAGPSVQQARAKDRDIALEKIEKWWKAPLGTRCRLRRVAGSGRIEEW